MVEVSQALFPLSGDPITNGHLNIIQRACRWVKKLVVVVLENDMKSSIMTLEERVEIIKSCLHSRGLKNILVDSYDGLLSDYATRSGIFHIIRGIRNANDLEYEIYLEYGHKKQNPKLEIIYFLSEPEHRTTSSSIARSILKKGGQIKDYVPLQVKRVMEEKLIGQYKLTITGSIASGKSFIANELVKSFKKDGHSAYSIDFDDIVKDIYEKVASDKYKNLKLEIIDFFGKNIFDQGKVSQSKLSREVFNPTDPLNQKRSPQKKLSVLLGLIRPYIHSHYHKQLSAKTGLILLNIPMVGESKMLYESNNNILLIDSDVRIQEQRLIKGRNMTLKEAQLRIKHAGTTKAKKKIISDIIAENRVGKLLIYQNNVEEKNINPKSLVTLKQQILKLFPNLKSIKQSN